MPLPLTVSCFSKIQIGFTFLVPAHLGSPGKRAVKRVCVCVCSGQSVWDGSVVVVGPCRTSKKSSAFLYDLSTFVTCFEHVESSCATDKLHGWKLCFANISSTRAFEMQSHGSQEQKQLLKLERWYDVNDDECAPV